MPLPPPSWVIPAPGCRPRRRWLVRLALALVVLAMLSLGALCVGLLVACLRSGGLP